MDTERVPNSALTSLSVATTWLSGAGFGVAWLWVAGALMSAGEGAWGALTLFAPPLALITAFMVGGPVLTLMLICVALAIIALLTGAMA